MQQSILAYRFVDCESLVPRDEDHLALFIELLGRMPKRISGTGKYAKDYFNRHGELRHIKKMRFWPLDKVLTEKYHLPQDEVSILIHCLAPLIKHPICL